MKKRKEKLNQDSGAPIETRPESREQSGADADFAAQLAEMLRAELEAPRAVGSATRTFRPVKPGQKADPAASATRSFAPAQTEEEARTAAPSGSQPVSSGTRTASVSPELWTEAPARRETATVIPPEEPEEEERGGRRRLRLFGRRNKSARRTEAPAPEAEELSPEPPDPVGLEAESGWTDEELFAAADAILAHPAFSLTSAVRSPKTDHTGSSAVPQTGPADPSEKTADRPALTPEREPEPTSGPEPGHTPAAQPPVQAAVVTETEEPPAVEIEEPPAVEIEEPPAVEIKESAPAETEETTLATETGKSAPAEIEETPAAEIKPEQTAPQSAPSAAAEEIPAGERIPASPAAGTDAGETQAAPVTETEEPPAVEIEETPAVEIKESAPAEIEETAVTETGETPAVADTSDGGSVFRPEPEPEGLPVAAAPNRFSQRRKARGEMSVSELFAYFSGDAPGAADRRETAGRIAPQGSEAGSGAAVSGSRADAPAAPAAPQIVQSRSVGRNAGTGLLETGWDELPSLEDMFGRKPEPDAPVKPASSPEADAQTPPEAHPESGRAEPAGQPEAETAGASEEAPAPTSKESTPAPAEEPVPAKEERSPERTEGPAPEETQTAAGPDRTPERRGFPVAAIGAAASAGLRRLSGFGRRMSDRLKQLFQPADDLDDETPEEAERSPDLAPSPAEPQTPAAPETTGQTVSPAEHIAPAASAAEASGQPVSPAEHTASAAPAAEATGQPVSPAEHTAPAAFAPETTGQPVSPAEHTAPAAPAAEATGQPASPAEHTASAASAPETSGQPVSPAEHTASAAPAAEASGQPVSPAEHTAPAASAPEAIASAPEPAASAAPGNAGEPEPQGSPAASDTPETSAEAAPEEDGFLALIRAMNARLDDIAPAQAILPGQPPSDVPADLQTAMADGTEYEQLSMPSLREPGETTAGSRPSDPAAAAHAESPAESANPDTRPKAAQQTGSARSAAGQPSADRPQHRWSRKKDRLAPVGLTVEDLLAAAVPIEQAAPPAGAGSAGGHRRAYLERDPLFTQPEIPSEISTVPENPEGLTPPDPAARTRADAAPSAVPETSIREPGAAETVVSAAARRRQADREAAPAEPEAQQDTPSGPEDLDIDLPLAMDPDRDRRRTQKEPPVRKKKPKPEAPAQKIPEPEPEPELPAIDPAEAEADWADELRLVRIRMILTGILSALCLFFTLYLGMGWDFLPEIFSGGTTSYLMLLMQLILLACSFREIADAFLALRRWRFEPMLLILTASLFTGLDAIRAAQSVRAPFAAIIGGLLLINLWGRSERLKALITTVRVVQEEPLSAGVSEVQDITKGTRGLTRTEPEPERFLRKLGTRSLVDRTMGVYTPIALIGGLIITLLITIGLHMDLFWTGSLVFIGSVPVTGLLAFPRLFRLVSQRLSVSHAALCGEYGAEVFGGEHAILIGDDDIFPPGSLSLNGFKVYNGSMDQIIAYTAAASRRSGSALAPVFDDLLNTHNGRHYNVDSFRFYDSGGIGAVIQDAVVLMGSLDFMRRMGVHMDPGTKVRQAVYVSVNGELAAVFAVRYAPPENIRRGLASIAGNRHFKGILVTRTFLGTPSFLKAKFGVPTGAFDYPSTKERLRLSETELKNSGAQGALLSEDSFTGFAQAAAGGRVLRSASVLSGILAFLGGVVGLLLMGVLAALPAYETATATNILIYVAAWLVPTLLLTAWGRRF